MVRRPRKVLRGQRGSAGAIRRRRQSPGAGNAMSTSGQGEEAGAPGQGRRTITVPWFHSRGKERRETATRATALTQGWTWSDIDPPLKLSRNEWLFLALSVIGWSLFVISLGKDTSWDFRNYHWYIPYALLNDRLGLDVAVAHQASYYNPLLDV